QHLLGLSVSANLKGAVASRQREQMLARLNENHLSAAIEVDELDSAGKGSAVFISSASMPSYFGFSGLGVKGKPAERVADEAINQLLTFLESGAALDRYLADQVLIPLSVASENSQFRIETVSKHFVTNVEIIRKFLDVSIEFVRSNNGSARVDIEPASTLSWA
ncbi:MAG: RNA 3'-terminal phosphate cyclase, partial [Anaerolineales bacterium]